MTISPDAKVTANCTIGTGVVPTTTVHVHHPGQRIDLPADKCADIVRVGKAHLAEHGEETFFGVSSNAIDADGSEDTPVDAGGEDAATLDEFDCIVADVYEYRKNNDDKWLTTIECHAKTVKRDVATLRTRLADAERRADEMEWKAGEWIAVHIHRNVCIERDAGVRRALKAEKLAGLLREVQADTRVGLTLREARDLYARIDDALAAYDAGRT